MGREFGEEVTDDEGEGGGDVDVDVEGDVGDETGKWGSRA